MTWWAAAAPAIAATFTASLVEAVEAMTIVLAVLAVRGPRPALSGTAAGLLCLTLIILVFGPVLNRIPIHALQLGVGVLLLLFGTRWLRKAILRASGIIPLHDEARAYSAETAYLREEVRHRERRLDWLGAVTSFKAVMIEGIEVVFIVIAVGAGGERLAAASLGALAACALVLLTGLALRYAKCVFVLAGSNPPLPGVAERVQRGPDKALGGLVCGPPRVLELSVGARLINSGGQILSQNLQDALRWDAGLLTDILDVLVAECAAQLIAVHGHVFPFAEPRLDLLAQASRA